MTDLTHVLILARALRLTESTVDTPRVVESLAELRRSITEASADDPALAGWLSQEHLAGGVLSTAATMNKRAEQSGKGAPFDVQSRATLIARYNAWAMQLQRRIEAYIAGRADIAAYARQLAAFHADPIHNEP